MDTAGLELWIGPNYVLSGNFRQLMPAALIAAQLGRYHPMTDASKRSGFPIGILGDYLQAELQGVLSLEWGRLHGAQTNKTAGRY